jgi:hypothetical protein
METWLLLGGTVLAWAVVEGYLLANKKRTISGEFQALFRQWPTFGVLFALIAGLLLGHWFWP